MTAKEHPTMSEVAKFFTNETNEAHIQRPKPHFTDYQPLLFEGGSSSSSSKFSTADVTSSSGSSGIEMTKSRLKMGGQL